MNDQRKFLLEFFYVIFRSLQTKIIFQREKSSFCVLVLVSVENYIYFFSNESYHIYNTTSMLFSLRVFCSWCYLNNTCVGRLILYTNYRLQMKRPNAEVVKIQILFICTSFTITIIVLRKTLKYLPPPVCKIFYAS